MVHDSAHTFKKYSVSSFNEITSIDSKFDTLNKFAKILKNYRVLKVKPKKQNKRKYIDYKDFMKIYRKCTSEPYSFDTTLLDLTIIDLEKILYIPYKNGINR